MRRKEFELLASVLGKPSAIRRTEQGRGLADISVDLKRISIANSVHVYIYQNLVEYLGDQVDGPLCELVRLLRGPVLREIALRRPRVALEFDVLRKTLGTAQVPFIFLRGHPFATRFYSDPKLRLSGDVDLLIPRQHFREAIRVLEINKYALQRSREYTAASEAYIGQVELKNPDSGIIVDLNWALTGNGRCGPLSMDMDMIWKRSIREIDTEHSLSVSDELIQVIDHCVRGHDFGDQIFKAILDARAIIRTAGDQIDYEYVGYQTRVLRATTSFNQFIYLFNEFESLGGGSVRLQNIRGATHFTGSPWHKKILIFNQQKLLTSRSPLRTIVLANLEITNRVWMADSLLDILRLWRTPLMPLSDELVINLEDMPHIPKSLRRMLFTVGFLLCGCLGILCGHVAFGLRRLYFRNS